MQNDNSIKSKKSENPEQNKFSLERDFPYVVKQYQNNYTQYQAQKVKNYYENIKNKNIFIKHDFYINKPNDLKDDENNATYQYYLFNHLHILPLRIFIQKLNKNKIDEIQKKIVEILISSIIFEYRLIWTDHQLHHNNISAENILITSNKSFYFANTFSLIDVRFINFGISMESQQVQQQKDYQDLNKLIQELYQLINSKKAFTQLYFDDKTNQSVQLTRLNKKDKNTNIFDISWNQDKITALNKLFQENNNGVQLTHSVLKSIFQQYFYLYPAQNDEAFDKLTKQFTNLYQKIGSLQNTYKNEILNVQNTLNLYIKQNYCLEISIDSELLQNFDKNVFDKIVYLANFKQGAIQEIEKILDNEYERTLSDAKKQIQNHFQSELEIFIYNLYCDLI